MSLTFILAQIVGCFAIVMSMTVYQVNKRSSMLLFGMGAGMMYAVHFWLLGAVTGAAMNILAIGRSYAFYRIKPSKHNRWILMLFLIANVIAAILTWQGPISLLPLFGTVAGGVAGWQRRPKMIRRFGLLPPPLWLVYNVASGSYAGVAAEIFRFTSNLVGQYRFDFRHRAHIRHKLAHPA